MKTTVILPTAAYYSLTYGQLAANTTPLPTDIIEAGRANEELKTEINKKRKK